MEELNPVRIGIGLNLVMVIANFVVPYDSALGRWYFDSNGMFWIMGGMWAVLLTWAVAR